MPFATLLQKAYGNYHAETIEPALESICQGLKAQVRVKGATPQGWVRVEVDGEDEAVALQLLSNEFWLTPTEASSIEKFSVLGGRIVDYRRTTTGLLVDVGVYEPKVVYANVPSKKLQAQLADGENLPLQRLTQFFCLCDYVPLCVKIVDADFKAQNGAFLAELSERQLAIFNDWLRSMLDRLLILGATQRDVKRALEASKHFRDVVRTESLGWLEHAIVCKLGTDAVGLIPAMGRFLPRAIFAPFVPRKILSVVNRRIL